MSTLPLFPDLPEAPERAVKPVAIKASQAPLSKEQQAFNKLIKQIETRRTKLAEWQSAIDQFDQKYAAELAPLHEKTAAIRLKLLHSLDRSYSTKGLTKPESRKLSQVIVELAEALLEIGDNEAAKAIYNRHTGSDYDAEALAQEEFAREQIKAMAEDVLGIELPDDIDLSSPEAVIAQMESQYRAQEEAREAAAANRKKSAKQAAKEAKAQAEEKQISQSIREVYRKLVSALHPDREADPDERQRKTALMQRVNEAYEKKNLLQLLELQLELEHIDQAHLAGLDPTRLRRYNKVLKEQLAELDTELEFIELDFGARYNLPMHLKLKPEGILPILAQDIGTQKNIVKNVTELVDAVSDLPGLKVWLKSLTRTRR